MINNISLSCFILIISKITGSLHLAREVEYNILYNMISHGLKLRDRTIRDYCKFFQAIYRLIISFMLIVANKIGLTDFEHMELLKELIILCLI